MTSTSCKLEVLALCAALAGAAACDAPEPAERADDGDASSSGDENGAALDEAEIIEQGQRYADELVKLSEEPEQEETHADAAAVVVWASASAAEDFFSIDTDDPTQSLSFAPGTFFVKEHLDEAGATKGLTLMYKAEPGYNPEGGDWFWARIDGDTVKDAGRVDWCSSCHAAAHNSDFVVGFGKSP